MAPPVTIPPKPEGAKGFQFAGFTSIPPTTRNVRMAPIFMATITLLASADSRTPRTSSKVKMKTIKKSGQIEVGARPLARGPHGARPFVRQIQPKRGQLRLGVAAEAYGDRDVAHGVFENQIPADDPGEDFAQRGVGIGVGAAGDRNHGGQFGVAKSGKTAGDGHEQKRDSDGRSSGWTPVHEHGRGTAVPQIIDEQVEDLRVKDGRRLEIFAGGGRAGQNKNSRADDRADTERRERPGAERFLQPVFGRFGVSQQLVDAFERKAAKSRAAAGRAQSILAEDGVSAEQPFGMRTAPGDPSLPLFLQEYHSRGVILCLVQEYHSTMVRAQRRSGRRFPVCTVSREFPRLTSLARAQTP